MFIKLHISLCDCLFWSVTEEDIQKRRNMNPLMLKDQCHVHKTNETMY